MCYQLYFLICIKLFAFVEFISSHVSSILFISICELNQAIISNLQVLNHRFLYVQYWVLKHIH